MNIPKVTVLCGGYGGARFVDGLKHLKLSGTCIVNTADDFTKFRLKVCPDIDSVIYSLASRFDEDRGYGIKNDTFRFDRALSYLIPQWFHIGDKDLHTHLYRTYKLRRSKSLTLVTESLAKKYHSAFSVLPMSNNEVKTVITTEMGDMGFQEFIVKNQAKPKILSIAYRGVLEAKAEQRALDCVNMADLVIIGPSSPIASILPILSVEGIRPALKGRMGPTVAISPIIVNKEPVTLAQKHRADLRAKFMNAIGLDHSPLEVAKLYRDFIDIFVLDFLDSEFKDEIEALGIKVVQSDLLAESGQVRIAATNVILDSALSFKKTKTEVT